MVHQLDYFKYTFADLTFMVSQYSGCLTINKTHLIFSLSIFFTTMKCCVELISFFIGTESQCNIKKYQRLVVCFYSSGHD